MSLFLIFILITIISTLIQSLPLLRFIKCLEKKYPLVWADMGKPTEENQINLFTAIEVAKKLYKRDFNENYSDEANSYCERQRKLILTTFLIGWLGLITAMIVLIVLK